MEDKTEKPIDLGQIAFETATGAALAMGASEAGNWMELGQPAEADDGAGIAKLGLFLRSNPGVPAEALYRFAQGQQLHDGEADGFHTIDAPFRVAYTVFSDTLALLDRTFAEESQRAAQATQQASEPPVPAAFAGDREDAIDRLSGGIADRVDGARRGPAKTKAKGKGK